MDSAALRGKTALVTGASRGAGWGIAVSLGAAGATVFVTGRSARGAATTENMPGTVDDTADEVTRRGGNGIAIRCDHTNDDEVTALFARIKKEQGKLDVLVNNVWGGYEQHDFRSFLAPFWEQPKRYWEAMFVAGVRAHLMASQLAAPLMIEQKHGLIVNTIAWDAGKYLKSIYYDLSKTAISRMALGMAQELKPHNVAAVALAPGFMRTERVMAAHARHPFDLSGTESTEYLGRAVVALASDANIMQKSGQTLTVGDLAQEYGFTDVDGKQPPPFRTT